jgi:hypothetical protein
MLKHPSLKILRTSAYADNLGISIVKWSDALTDLKGFLELVAAQMEGSDDPDDPDGQVPDSPLVPPSGRNILDLLGHQPQCKPRRMATDAGQQLENFLNEEAREEPPGMYWANPMNVAK